jgi:predicted dehydrogenase
MPGYGGSRWFVDWIQQYIDAIRNDTEPAMTIEDGLHVLQCIEAVYESARTGRRVEVEYGL